MVACAAIMAIVTSWPELLPRAISGSVVLLRLVSVLMSVREPGRMWRQTRLF